MIYNLIYLSSTFTNVMTFKNFDLRRLLYIATMVVFFIFVTFRWDVGCDWGSYLHHADVYGSESVGEALERNEQGYWLLVILLDRLGLAYPAINVVASSIFFLGIHSIARRQPDPLMYISLLFPVLITGIPMSATRQAIAMGFICFAFNAFQDRKSLKFLMWVIVALLFHASASAFVCLFPLLLTRTLKTKIIAGIFLIGPVGVYLLMSDTAKSYTDLYVGTAHDAAGGPARAAIVAGTGLVFLIALRKRWKAYCPADYELMFYASPIMVAVFPIVFYSSVIGDRFGYYMMPLAYAIQSRAYLMTTSPTMRSVAFAVPFLVGAVALLVWSQLSWIFATCYLPYQTWWWNGT